MCFRVGGDKKHVADAKKGVFHHDGELLNKWQMQQFQLGKMRHPRTGDFIKAEDLEKAEEGLILLSDGRWVTGDEADKFHSNKSRPWTFRTKYCYLVSTVKLAELEKMGTLMDVGAARLFKIFGHGSPPPTRPAVIRMAKTTELYRTFGERLGTGDDCFGVYIASGAPAATVDIQGGRSRLVIMNYGESSWRPFFGRHAAGLALCQSFFGDEIDDVPAWFLRGIGCYAARFMQASQIKHFGRQHKDKGGVGNLKEWFDDFKITIDISPSAVHGNMFQAGLLISFCLKGGDKRATNALMKVTQACQKGGKAAPAVENLQRVLASRQKQVKAYFENLIK